MYLLYYLQATNWFWIEGGSGWLYAFVSHFSSTQTVPSVLSVSYAWSEQDQVAFVIYHAIDEWIFDWVSYLYMIEV